MRVLKGLPIPAARTRSTYDFDLLEHGDAIEVGSVSSAREVFRRWRRSSGRTNTRLIVDRDNENRLFFVDDDREEV